MTPHKIHRRQQVRADTGHSDSTLLRRIHAGLFVRPIALGRRSVGWRAQEVAEINAAVIRGASEDELRQLVRQLEASRKTFTPENTTSAPDSNRNALAVPPRRGGATR